MWLCGLCLAEGALRKGQARGKRKLCPAPLLGGVVRSLLRRVAHFARHSQGKSLLRAHWTVGVAGRTGKLAQSLSPSSITQTASALVVVFPCSPHKSNAVFLVVSLREFAFCQKCHDADCRGFRSSPRLLPPALVQLLQSRAAEEAAPIQASFEAVQREAPFPPSETLKKTSQQQQQREGLLEGEATGASFRTDDFEQTADEEELDIAAAAVPDFENGSWT